MFGAVLIPTLDQVATETQGQEQGRAVRALGAVIRKHTLINTQARGGQGSPIHACYLALLESTIVPKNTLA